MHPQVALSNWPLRKTPEQMLSTGDACKTSISFVLKSKNTYEPCSTLLGGLVSLICSSQKTIRHLKVFFLVVPEQYKLAAYSLV